MSVATTTLHPTLAALGLGPPEVILILLVLLLLFGGRKLPEMARGTGRALRIFKSETKGLMDDDDQPSSPQARTALPPGTPTARDAGQPLGGGATAAPPADASGYTSESLPPTHTEK